MHIQKVTMTFKELANKLGIHLYDLIPDVEQAESMKNETIFKCVVLEDLISDGYLNENLEFVKPYALV